MADEQQRVYALYKQEEQRLKELEAAASNKFHAERAASFLTNWLPPVLVVWNILVLTRTWKMGL
jgi:hypothetical protein